MSLKEMVSIKVKDMGDWVNLEQKRNISSSGNERKQKGVWKCLGVRKLKNVRKGISISPKKTGWSQRPRVKDIWLYTEAWGGLELPLRTQDRYQSSSSEILTSNHWLREHDILKTFVGIIFHKIIYFTVWFMSSNFTKQWFKEQGSTFFLTKIKLQVEIKSIMPLKYAENL